MFSYKKNVMPLVSMFALQGLSDLFGPGPSFSDMDRSHGTMSFRDTGPKFNHRTKRGPGRSRRDSRLHKS